MFKLSDKNSIANDYMAQLRDVSMQANSLIFRNNLRRLGVLLAYEVSKELPNSKLDIHTPLGTKQSNCIAKLPILITVLRAGLPFYEGFLEVFDGAKSGFVGAYREEGNSQDFDIFMGYSATPAIDNEYVILIDPMLATGKSIVKVIKNMTANQQAKHIFICSVIAAPEGIDYIKKEVGTSISFFIGDLDERLDKNAYIVPGLGDAGDLSFGPKR